MGLGTDDIAPQWRTASPDRARVVQRRVEKLAFQLASAYGTPDLGNLAEPLDEAVYILLTYQTDIARAKDVWARIKACYPTWGELMNAPIEDVEAVLRPSGFHKTRARLIKRFLGAVQERFGSLSLDTLRDLSDADAEAELRDLLGFDTKGARCVLLYSLGRSVFPVDSNTFRFMRRYGILSESARYRRRSLHESLQNLIPRNCRYTLHVNLVAHGQKTCLPRTPKCAECVVKRTCQTGRTLT